MKVLLIQPNYETKFAPLGLMRISSLHKSKGDEVMYVKGMKKLKYQPDKIYLTTLFTYAVEGGLRYIVTNSEFKLFITFKLDTLESPIECVPIIASDLSIFPNAGLCPPRTFVTNVQSLLYF